MLRFWEFFPLRVVGVPLPKCQKSDVFYVLVKKAEMQNKQLIPYFLTHPSVAPFPKVLIQTEVTASPEMSRKSADRTGNLREISKQEILKMSNPRKRTDRLCKNFCTGLY